jgi:soluble lytic murein transglycosylase-like protein
MRFAAAFTGIAVAALIGFSALPATAAAPLQALSTQDAQNYAAAFDAAERGDFAAADQAMAKVSDPCLAGRVQYVELTHPKAKNTSFQVLASWLKAFGDLPGADKVYALALKLRPAGDMPPAPSGPTIASAGDQNAGRYAATAQSRPAREAFNDGDMRRALELAQDSGDHWIAGLAAYRLGQYTQALTSFQAVAGGQSQDDGHRSAGAYWAARSAQAAGIPEQATAMLKIAAATPDTFYGMIAARKLQLADDPLGRIIDTATRLPAAAPPMLTAAVFQPTDDATLRQLVSTDPRARRAVALMQLGRRIDAGSELRAGVAQASDEPTRAAWMRLMYRLNPDAPQGEVVLHSESTPQPSAFYPTPDLVPAGGFTVDKALVYAVVWQESRFNSLAVSPVGAIGLMQLMPPSAASMAGDARLTADPIPLFDTGKNLQLGQQYLTYLINRSSGDDILRAVAAYNGGPATVSRTEAIVGPDTDSLMLMESLPYPETRAYVQKVMAAYWTYRRQFGVESPTLDAAASDAKYVDARLDSSASSQNPKPAAAAPARQALEIMLHRAG